MGTAQKSQPAPKAVLSLGDAVFIGAGSMIGAGLFAAFAPATAAAGPWLFFSLALAAGIALCNATSSAQLAAQHPESGGTYIYGRRQLGHLWGYLAGWCFLVGKTASCAAMALTFGAYLFPGHEKLLAIIALWVLTAVNYRGITRTAALTKILVTLVLLALAVFGAALALGTDPAPVALPSPEPAGSLYGILQGAGLLFFAFAGYARIATMGSEVRDPARTIPRAINLTLALITVLYTVVAFALVSQLGYGTLAASSAPLAQAVGSVPALSQLMGVAAALAALGALLALITGIGRTGYAMASHKDLPSFFARLHPTYAVPHRLELLLASVATLLILATDLRGAIGFSSFGVLLYYLIANISAYTQSGSHRIYPRWLQLAGACGCLLVVLTLPAVSLAGGTLMVALGLLVYWFYARPRASAL